MERFYVIAKSVDYQMVQETWKKFEPGGLELKDLRISRLQIFNCEGDTEQRRSVKNVGVE